MRTSFWTGLAAALSLTACNFSSSSTPTPPVGTATWTGTATATATSTGSGEDASTSFPPEAGAPSTDATVDAASNAADATIEGGAQPDSGGGSNDGGAAGIPSNSGIVTLAATETAGIGYSEVTAAFVQNESPALTFWFYDGDGGVASVTTALTDLFLDAGAQYSDAGYFYYKDSGAILYEDGGVLYDDAGVFFGVWSFGACQVVEVGSQLSQSDGGPEAGTSNITEVSAGTLTVTGGTAPIVIAPTSTAGYVSYSYLGVTGAGDAGPSFAAGDTLTVSANGAAAPAFSATVTVPGTIQVTEPPPPPQTLPDGAPLGIPMLAAPIARTTDLPLAWTGGSSGTSSSPWRPRGLASNACFPRAPGAR
jgi:hypothetical protein